VTSPDDDLRPPPAGRLAGALLVLSALLVLGFALAFLLDDGAGALVLVLLLAVVTLPVLGAALLSFRPGWELLQGGPAPARTAACAALLAVGHVGVALVALRPGQDRELSNADLIGGGVGALGLGSALVTLALVLPGRTAPLRVLLALSVGVLVLALVALRAVAQTS
jgi:hypothetical protein